jgi:hypothetical protein
MSARLIAPAPWMVLALFTLAVTPIRVGAQESCGSAPSVVIDAPLYFGSISVREGGAGAVVVSVRGGVTSVGDVMTDGRGEIGRMTVCGDAGSQLYLTISSRQAEPANAHVVASHRMRDFEVQATGAVIERRGENTWLVTLGARGRGAITVGGTLVVLPFVVRGAVVQTFIVSVVAAKAAAR